MHTNYTYLEWNTATEAAVLKDIPKVVYENEFENGTSNWENPVDRWHILLFFVALLNQWPKLQALRCERNKTD